jgi:predicted ABC-type sugar transport system permease subunit
MAMFSEQCDVSILPIAINFQFIADEFFINNNMINIQNEITITLWHELAHGLIWAISDNGYDIPFDYDNEEICE